jgi:hypothetical protein
MKQLEIIKVVIEARGDGRARFIGRRHDTVISGCGGDKVIYGHADQVRVELRF